MTWGTIATVSTWAGLGAVVAAFAVVIGSIWLGGNYMDERREAEADRKMREWSERDLW